MGAVNSMEVMLIGCFKRMMLKKMMPSDKAFQPNPLSEKVEPRRAG
jgi:hypothetical protein